MQPKRGAGARAVREFLSSYGAYTAVGGGWVVVLLLWSAGIVQLRGAFALLMGACVVAVYGAIAVAGALRGEPPLTAARKAIVLVLLVAVPVAYDPRLVDVFGAPKLALLSVGALALVVLWLVEAFAQGSRPGPRRSWVRGLALAFLAWTVLATVFSTSPRISALGFFTDADTSLGTTLSLGILFLTTVDTIRPEDVKAVLSLLYFGAGSLVVLAGMVPIVDQWAGPVYVSGANGEPVRATHVWVASTLGNPNHVAGFLAMTFLVGLVLGRLTRSRWQRAGVVTMSGVILLELVYTATRGAFAALFAALVVTALLLAPEIRRRRRLAVAVLGVFFVCVAGAVALLAATSDLRDLLEAKARVGSDSSVALRADVWRSAVRMTLDRPLLGMGPDTLQIHMPSYQPARLAGILGPREVVNDPHNLFVEVLYSRGFPGLAIFLALLAAMALLTARTWRRHHQMEGGGPLEPRLLLVAVVSGLVGYVVQATFNVQQVSLALVFWVLLGLLVVLGREPTVVARAAPGGRETRVALGLAVGAVAFLVGGWLLIAPYRAERSDTAALRDQKVATLVVQKYDLQFASPYIVRAKREFGQAIATTPWEAQFWADRAELRRQESAELAAVQPPPPATQVGHLRAARADYERALSLQPKRVDFLQAYAQVLLNLHRLLPTENGLAAEAVAALRRARRVSPGSEAVARALEAAEAAARR